MGSSSANAQIPNPFHKNQPKEQAAQQTAQQPAKAAGQKDAAAPQAGQTTHDVMAVVNGQDIKRDALGTACVERFGKEVLEGLVNKRLIMHHCRNRNIEVTDQEVDAEIDRMAKRFKIGREQWLQMLERERGINAEQYKRDILWPTLALRKCAADQTRRSATSSCNEAYEAQYGPAVKCRLIVVADRKLAEQLHRQVDRPARRLCPPGDAELGRRQQREHRRPDPADSPSRGRSEHRARSVRDGRRTRFHRSSPWASNSRS